MQLTNEQYLQLLGQKEIQIYALQVQLQQIQQEKEYLEQENQELRTKLSEQENNDG